MENVHRNIIDNNTLHCLYLKMQMTWHLTISLSCRIARIAFVFSALLSDSTIPVQCHGYDLPAEIGLALATGCGPFTYSRQEAAVLTGEASGRFHRT